MTNKQVFHSQIWQEDAEENNPFEAKACYCHGFDVYGDLLGKASWAEYLYLLLKGERPSLAQAQLLESLAVAFANRGPRDHSIRAAMNGGVGGTTAAGSLMAALAVGAGQYGGAHEVFHAVNVWRHAGQDITQWETVIQQLLVDKTWIFGCRWSMHRGLIQTGRVALHLHVKRWPTCQVLSKVERCNG